MVTMNKIPIKGIEKKPINHISIEKLIFQKERLKQVKPPVKLASQLNEKVVTHINDYLTQEEHRNLIRDSFGDNEKKGHLRKVISSYVSTKTFLDEYASIIEFDEVDEMTDYLVEKIAGLGVLQSLSEIPTVTDIKCFNWDNIWADDIYKGFYKTNLSFENDEEYRELCTRFAFASGKPYSAAKPTVNAIFPYMRINIVGHDLSPKVALSIRIISKKLRFTEADMLETGYANQDIINLLTRTFATESHLIAGATGTGKTELFRYFTRNTRNDKVIAMIEDTPESYLDEIYPYKPINMFKVRDSMDDNKEQFGYRYLVKQALRQFCFYLFIQESRGPESLDILEASNTGHIVNTTLHSDSAEGSIDRFIDLCQQARMQSPEYYGKRIVKGFPIGLHVKKFGNVRKISEVVEYLDFVDGKAVVNVLIKYDPKSKQHIQKNKLSKRLWESLSEYHTEILGDDMQDIQHLVDLEDNR